ncbi:hypothetical protein JCM33374_g4762 [Metschnikowia sp. JCM 33374]|nr:hypothetical protein JCM33374_g4762 [Metschnikowia sp. JCM 33374]
MSEIQRLPQVMNPNPVHPNAKSTTQITNGTTTTKSNIGSPVCRNCKTQTTPLWRRDETGQVLCNACGLFLKLHGRPRPISLKTDTIKSRNRIKQPNFSKSSGPNTPELKSKDAKVSIQPNQNGQNGQPANGQPANGSNGSNGPNGPNGPNGQPNGRISPLSATSRRSPNGSPLDSITHGSYTNTTGIHSPLQHARHAPYSGSVYPQQMNGFHGALPHQVQSLHYPSSTPTQFAPGLQRITSPLLLSTTPSISNARSSASTGPNSSVAPITSPQGSLTAMQAAGALENMSNELGPSASFKGASSSQNNTGVSLMAGSVKVKPEPNSLSTPSSALKTSPHPPSLPALGSGHDKGEKVLASPSFGPQFLLSDSQQGKQNHMEHPMPALPPIQHVQGSALPPQLPHLPSNLGSASYSAVSTPETHPTPLSLHSQASQSLPSNSSQASPHMNSASAGNNQSSYGSNYGYPGASHQPSAGAGTGGGAAGSGSASSSGNMDGNSNGRPDGSNSRSGQGDKERNPHNNNNNNQGSGSGSNPNNSYEVNVLKTRISELELVNDLYRTRIMELEAMEQAARLRENSMRRRLDDLLKAQGYEESSSMLNNTMRVLKREENFDEDKAKRQKTG